ncbi:HU family DNA-binding protein [Pseudomonas sp. KSR10]|uniref:HU family DNA-binding protein n=1 Tax=Pseudomonas sp. KSR10 TaxID=2916654 RepID=UPI001EF83E8C|nr:HU family DNA-binding protein [Pseudomonas sp. KSR10]MCG6538791.1 HU family DNA-binding protein [Pseudomonas sp. KSR10]
MNRSCQDAVQTEASGSAATCDFVSRPTYFFYKRGNLPQATGRDAAYTDHPTKSGATPVNKAELIEAIAASADVPKSTATRVLDAFTESVTNTLQNGDSVTLVGFGTFAVKERAARDGRNPQTGATIKISAAKLPGFKPGKSLKDAVN